ncbi:MAG: class I SAM-dependent methyltransferase [Dehalococcoidia bacterium]|nr:class I SAM-dependent methyltransferase [Dehalococcoidia bacterium]
MDNYREDTYGERIAGVYDDWYREYDDAAVAVLHELAQGGRALELGIGTGRVALPLQRSGIAVEGIDSSEAMIARLRSKPGGDKIPVGMGDLADVAVEGQYTLIFVLVNTFFALLTQEEQVRCFRNVAQHLHPRGSFVVEAFVPDLSRFTRRQCVTVADMSEDEVQFDASRHDPVSQQITAQQIVLTEQGIRLYPVKLRYVWPSELDLMARLAGLQLKHRWGDWRKAPFSADSRTHVSVYEHGQQSHG